MHRRLVAQCDGIAGIDDAGDDHQRVAEIELECQQARNVAMGCSYQYADQGDGKADHLGDRRPRAKQHEVEQEDQHRNAGLENDGVDGARVFQRRIEQRVEGGETDRAIGEKLQPVLADLVPVASDLRRHQHQDDDQREDPAQGRQHHRAYVSDRHLAGDGIAAPEERGDAEIEIGPGIHDAATCAGMGDLLPRWRERRRYRR
ncbi:hypothetical protein D9M72_542690 [compost metagenome]